MPSWLEKRFPPSTKEEDVPPPAYAEEQQQGREPAGPIRPLNLSRTAGPERITSSTSDECIAHLKLLAAFADLRDTIGRTDDLFGISNRVLEAFSGQDDMNKVAASLSEKRWAVYVARAVERFTVWWTKCVPIYSIGGDGRNITVSEVERGLDLKEATTSTVKIQWTRETVPPLGEFCFFTFFNYFSIVLAPY